MIYLDYMSSTPVDPRVVAIMKKYLSLDGHFANPSSKQHQMGRTAGFAIATAREQVANTIGCAPRDIIFTSGATEAINMALKCLMYRDKKHIISSTIEHKAVLDTLAFLEKYANFHVDYVTPDSDGIINIECIENKITADTAAVVLHWVNNEIGVIQPIEALADLLYKKNILLIVDGAQGLGKLNIHTNHISMLALSGHKCYAPKGIGCLYIQHELQKNMLPLMHGGGQELGLRSGTLPTHQIAAFGHACELIDHNEIAMIVALREQFLTLMGNPLINGCPHSRVPHNINISLPGTDANALLSRVGETLAISTQSACLSTALKPSYVLKALGYDDARIKSAIRISLGRFTTSEDIIRAVEILHRETASTFFLS